MPEITRRLEKLQLDQLTYFRPSRDIAEIPDAYYNNLLGDIEQNGLLRPLLIHSFLSTDFTIYSHVIQDGFVRKHILTELEIPDALCECRYFFPDNGIEVGTIQETVTINSVSFGDSESADRLNNPSAFPEEGDWSNSRFAQTYDEAVTYYQAILDAYTAKIVDIAANGQASHSPVNCYRNITQNEEGQWVYGGIKSQDDSLLNAVIEAGLEEVEVQIRLLDRRS